MEFDSLSPYYKKVIDFKNRASDKGLYIRDDRLIFFHRTTITSTAISPKTDFTVVLTRDKATGEVRGYTDGVLQWFFVDSAKEAVSESNPLIFFEDDTVTPGSVESQAGSADCIAVYDRALTGDEVAALLAGDGCASDSDGDGVEDGDDLFPNSNSEATVVINDCDSGVENKFVANGANFNDLIGAVMSKKTGGFVKQVTKMAKQWNKGGLITGREKGKITSCA